MGCRLRGWPTGCCLVILLGCNVYDPDLLQKSEGFAVGDDAGLVKPPACDGRVEACNAMDDDCDGKTDEGAESACGVDHSTSVCARGECVIVECASGYADCNRDIVDGCEQPSEEIACGMCGKICPGTNDGSSGGPNRPGTGGEGDEDAGSGVDSGPAPVPDAGPPPCQPSTERCDDVDNDCDDRTDEGTVCAVAMCVGTMPSARSSACDECVCGSCPQLVALCQNHPNATWAAQCRALVACVVEQSRMNKCPNGDCYGNGDGPCAAQTHIAAGGVDGNDRSQVIFGCTATSPPAAACAAAVNYRDQCTTTTCSATCGQ